MSLKATSSAGTSGELVGHLLRSAGDDRGHLPPSGEWLDDPFLAKAPTLDANWRVVVLFGRNVVSYKLALAKTLLGMAIALATA
jgi:hypothetical protein